MTRWGAALLVVALIPLAASSALPGLLVPGIAAIAVAAALVLADALRAPGRDRLQVTRDHDQILSVGRANPVAVHVGLRPRLGRRARPRRRHPGSGSDGDARPARLLPATVRDDTHPGWPPRGRRVSSGLPAPSATR